MDKEYWNIIIFEFKLITPPKDYDETIRLLKNIPKSSHTYYKNMIMQGLSPIDAFELLKDTYNF